MTHPLVPSSTALPSVQIQDDDYSILAMRKDMNRLLSIFNDAHDDDVCERTNTCRRRQVQDLATCADAEFLVENDIPTDALFLITHHVLHMIHTLYSARGRADKLYHLGCACRCVCINSAIDDLQRIIKGVGRGGREPHVLQTRYNAVIHVTTANIKAELLSSLRGTLPTDDALLWYLNTELQV